MSSNIPGALAPQTNSGRVFGNGNQGTSNQVDQALSKALELSQRNMQSLLENFSADNADTNRFNDEFSSAIEVVQGQTQDLLEEFASNQGYSIPEVPDSQYDQFANMLSISQRNMEDLMELYKSESREIQDALKGFDQIKDPAVRKEIEKLLDNLMPSNYEIRSTAIRQLLLAKIQDKIKKELKKQKLNSNKNIDPFEAALKLAIANDGEVDGLELSHLQRIRHRDAGRVIIINLEDDAFYKDHYTIRIEQSRAGNYSIQRSANNNGSVPNQALRDAFDIASLDGEISQVEIEHLQGLMIH